MKADIILNLDRGGIVRTVTIEDVSQAYVDGLNDPEVNRHLIGPRSQWQTLELVRAFIEANLAAPDALVLGLFVDGALRGTTRLHDIIPGRSGTQGVALFDRAYWGKGWGSTLIAASSAWLMAEFDLLETVAGIEEDNTASQRSFARAGFEPDPATFVGCGGAVARWWRRKRPSPKALFIATARS